MRLESSVRHVECKAAARDGLVVLDCMIESGDVFGSGCVVWGCKGRHLGMAAPQHPAPAEEKVCVWRKVQWAEPGETDRRLMGVAR